MLQLAHGKQPVELPVWSAVILDACGGLDRVQDYLLSGGGGGWDRRHRNHPRRRQDWNHEHLRGFIGLINGLGQIRDDLRGWNNRCRRDSLNLTEYR